MPHSLPVEASTVANLRDLGGVPLPGGRTVRSGLVFRSGQLDRLDPAADLVFAALGIRTVVDLRTERERAARPDRVPPAADLVVADVLADAMRAGAASKLATVMADPAAANRLLGDGHAEQALISDYRAFVTSASGRAAYRLLFTELARGTGPLLFHCTAGKDRTGWGAALLLLLLGADPATVQDDYLAVNPAVRAAFAPVITAFTDAGGDPEITEALLTVRPGYLAAALETLTDGWGDPEKYARTALGLDATTLTALRDRLTG
ncbi:protein-tyrosine phosphatase [Kitasatospora gansuensis]|uniref:Protein-tyrosine phosphatase n=1 Tax=Kitasatospora gansuensis TaxID=258050 RepID=A0A7W7WKI6_9ACTN|nr:tyrosine-protein phosphatase [Kitasatospora gansuensis]MBB4950862.1 protein-tyrosine phosphatase [Kitasatospora gansuensis]